MVSARKTNGVARNEIRNELDARKGRHGMAAIVLRFIPMIP